MNEIANAHEHWDRQWDSPQHRAAWNVAEDRVLQWAGKTRTRGGKRALDLGCGIGRHALALADMGYRVDALDGAPKGLEQTQLAAKDLGLEVTTHHGSMTELPFKDGLYDYIVSWNVIYHGDEAIVRQCLSEIQRVLRPGGMYQGTMLPLINPNYGVGEELGPGTWIDAGRSDKAHAHYYCDAATLTQLFDGFEIMLLEDYEQRPGNWHWHVVAEKPFR